MEQRGGPGADQCPLHFKHRGPLQVAWVRAQWGSPCNHVSPTLYYTSRIPSSYSPVGQKAPTVALSMSIFPPVERRSVEPLVSTCMLVSRAHVHIYCCHGYNKVVLLPWLRVVTGCTVAIVTGSNRGVLLPWLQVVTSTRGGGGRPEVTPGSSTCGGPHGKSGVGDGGGIGTSHSAGPSPTLITAPSTTARNYHWPRGSSSSERPNLLNIRI